MTLLEGGTVTMRDDWVSETVAGGMPVNSSLVCRVTLVLGIE